MFQLFLTLLDHCQGQIDFNDDWDVPSIGCASCDHLVAACKSKFTGAKVPDAAEQPCEVTAVVPIVDQSSVGKRGVGRPPANSVVPKFDVAAFIKEHRKDMYLSRFDHYFLRRAKLSNYVRFAKPARPV